MRCSIYKIMKKYLIDENDYVYYVPDNQQKFQLNIKFIFFEKEKNQILHQTNNRNNFQK